MPGLFDMLSQTWPARLAQGAWSGLTLPRDVYQGQVDPLSPEAIGRANSLAGLMMGGTFAAAAPRGAREMMASKSANMYNPPVKSPRPFEADYPHGAPADAAGRLTADLEGRALGAGYVVGRRVVGGADEALPATEFDALATAATGRSPALVAPSAIAPDVGRVTIDRYTRAPKQVYLSKGLTENQRPKVFGHELGHVIDQAAGEINTAGINRELAQLYNTGFTGRERTRNLTGPQHLGYKGEDVPRELVAEAIRFYLANPNYLKTVAPKTAAAIREAVNSHPALSKIIQFNTLAALMGLGALPAAETSAPELSQ